MKIIFGVTGSVAAKLTPKLLKKLQEGGNEVKIIATKSSLYFFHHRILFGHSHFSQFLKFVYFNVLGKVKWIADKREIKVPIFTEADEWPGHDYDKNDPVKHIELRDWAEVMVIAPLTANTLGKMANGLSDNMLTCVARAWDRKKPLVVAPAMNTKMWEHPATQEHLAKLGQWYDLTVVGPVAKKLACGDIGVGAMAGFDDIVKAVNEAGKRYLDKLAVK